MEQKTAGLIVIGIAILIGFIVFSFNRALGEIVQATCTHGASCPMWGTIDFQTNVSLGIMAFVGIIGAYLFLSKERSAPSRVSKEEFAKIVATLNNDEKAVYEKLVEGGGAVFQSELAEKSGFEKVKVTRILDKLEGRGILERRRRGMSNMVVLKRV